MQSYRQSMNSIIVIMRQSRASIQTMLPVLNCERIKPRRMHIGRETNASEIAVRISWRFK